MISRGSIVRYANTMPYRKSPLKVYRTVRKTFTEKSSKHISKLEWNSLEWLHHKTELPNFKFLKVICERNYTRNRPITWFFLIPLTKKQFWSWLHTILAAEKNGIDVTPYGPRTRLTIQRLLVRFMFFSISFFFTSTIP